MITRRSALRLGGFALVGASLAPSLLSALRGTAEETGRLFFDKKDIPRIRSNARTPLLAATYEAWVAESLLKMESAWVAFVASGNMKSDLGAFWSAFEHLAVVYVVEPTDERRDALLAAFERAIALPKWDYLMDGNELIGLLRAAMAASRLLFAREALGDAFGEELNERFLVALAEKGAAPCFRTISDLNNPDGATGWHYDPAHPKVDDFSVANWPYFLGRTNLRGTATIGLGLSALALRGRDKRSKLWLDTAVASTYSVFELFTPGGSYFEGLSYGAYAMRLVLQFCEAHNRVNGSIDWTKAVNWSGFIDDVAAMQAGKKADGTPDVVNFSDASASIHPCVGSWIQKRIGIPTAQYAAEHFASPGYFLDFLWYRPGQEAQAPSAKLMNYRNDLDWVVCRSGWEADDAVLAFRSGDPANHEHADRNSFLYKIYGERLLADHFGAAYERKDPKWTLRMTKAHNSVLIGGRGHQYHEGEEGVNEGKAKAKILSFVDRDSRVWWTSDATHGYRLVNPNVSKVLRTVVFAKPNVIVVLDQVELEDEPEQVEIRFFPDNRDNEAKVSRSGSRFELQRPRATLYGAFAGNRPLSISDELLDFKEDMLPGVSLSAGKALGDYPFVRARSSYSLKHELCTVMYAGRGADGAAPRIEINRQGSEWQFEVDGVKGTLSTKNTVPELSWFDEG